MKNSIGTKYQDILYGYPDGFSIGIIECLLIAMNLILSLFMMEGLKHSAICRGLRLRPAGMIWAGNDLGVAGGIFAERENRPVFKSSPIPLMIPVHAKDYKTFDCSRSPALPVGGGDFLSNFKCNTGKVLPITPTNETNNRGTTNG